MNKQDTKKIRNICMKVLRQRRAEVRVALTDPAHPLWNPISEREEKECAERDRSQALRILDILDED